MPKKKPSEADIQLEIQRYLKSKGYLFWRFDPSTYVPSIGIYIKHEYNPNGLPDTMVLSKNKFIGLETKRPHGGRNSADQILMKRRFELLGHEYHVVRSVDEVKKLGL